MKKILTLAALALAAPLTAQAELSRMDSTELQGVNAQGVLIGNLPVYADRLASATSAVIDANIALAITGADVATEARADMLDSQANFNDGVATRMESTGGPILTYKAGYFRLLADSEQYRADLWRGFIPTP
ncbi:hypothetical protein GXC69_02180 [Candidatus Macondimonas diazotrophica]|jgi:hypothetical protein|nr:hypothetical protein [Candidatus Macondimonas diazotrophica]